MKNPDPFICEIIESKMNGIIDKINETNSIIESGPDDPRETDENTPGSEGLESGIIGSD